jgi:cell division transport system permease protein
MSKKKLDAKAFAQQKRHRRQWITFMRMCRYGVNNFSRNAWLTIAATAVMTITLLVIFMTLVARNVLVDTVSDIREKVDMSIYVKTDIKPKDVETIQKNLKKLQTVKEAYYISPDEARKDFATENKKDGSTLEALNEATNVLPGTFRVVLVDINKTDELRQFVENDATYKKNKDPKREPSFAGERRSAIEEIGGWVAFAEKAGLIASAIFVAISSLIVFNTIRMAIFNRKDEIQMMKLIGADRNFIRGPFVVEAIVYGFIAAVLATSLSVGILYLSSPTLSDRGIVVAGTIDFITTYIGFVMLGMIILGALIGVVSSLLATRRYLHI